MSKDNERDRRYEIIAPLNRQGIIKSFSDIFEYIPKTTVAADMGKNKGRFSKLVKRVEGFTLEELFAIGRLCGLTESDMLKLVHAEYIKDKEKQKADKD